MNESSIGRRWGSQPASNNLDAPTLRPVMLPEGATEDLNSPCPSWCRFHGHGHPVDQETSRRHESEPLRVRQEIGSRVLGHYDESADELVTAFTHLEIRLTRAQHSEKRFGIEIRERFVRDKSLSERRLVPLHEFEVVELIAALQHLMRLGASS